MVLNKSIKLIIAKKLNQDMSEDFNEILQADPKDQIFKDLAVLLRPQKSIYKYPTDIYRLLHRHKDEIKESYDTFDKNKDYNRNQDIKKERLKNDRLSETKNSYDIDGETTSLIRNLTAYEVTLTPDIQSNNPDGPSPLPKYVVSSVSWPEVGNDSSLTEDKLIDSPIKSNPQTYSRIEISPRGRSNSDLPVLEKRSCKERLFKKSGTYPFGYFLKDLRVDFSERHKYLREAMISVGIHCVVVFKGSHQRKSNYPKNVEYGKCKHTGCRKFRFEYALLNNFIESVLVRFDRRNVCHDTEEHAYQLRGKERIVLKKTLMHTLPNTVRHSDIKDSDSNALREGNWHKIRSLGVYQKARSEARAELDLDKDSYLDLLLRCIREPEEFRYVQVPNAETMVYIYSKQQFDILYDRTKKPVAFFDATGSVVQPIKRGSTVYYYALVINIDNEILPVAELISSRHDTATLSCFFINLKRYVTVSLHRSWPVFSCIVTDWSFALIGGICFGLNDMTLYRYLSTIYSFLLNKSRDLRNIIILRCCCAHFIKMIINKLSKIKVDKDSRKLIVEMVSCIVINESLATLVILFRSLLIVLLSPYCNSNVQEALDFFKHEGVEINFESLHSLDTIVEESEDWEKERGKYVDSPFYVLFFKIYQEVTEVVSGFLDEPPCKKNSFHSEDFAKYLLNICMPFAPLWTGLLNPLISTDIKRYSNSNVECWFRIVKKDILNNDRRLKLGRFVEKSRERVESIIKTIEFDISKQTRKRPKSCEKQNESLQARQQSRKRQKSLEVKENVLEQKNQVDDPTKVETWRPRREKNSYFALKRLENLASRDLKKPVGSSIISRGPYIEDDCLNFEETYIRAKLTQLMKEVPGSENLRSSATEKRISPCLGNALFLVPSYYLSSYLLLKENFVLGLYKYEGHTLKIYGESFARLISIYDNCVFKQTDDRDRWLFDDCIDSMAYSMLKDRPDIYYINAISSTLLFSKLCGEFTAFGPLQKSFSLSEFIVMPVNIAELHWYLLILDIPKKTVHIFDSGGGFSHSNVKETIEYFFKLRNQRGLTEEGILEIDKWKIQEAEFCPKQNDAVNCGVYLLYFVSVLCNTKSISKMTEYLKTTSFDPEQFRIVIQQYLLVSSAHMSTMCLYCGSELLENYVSCEFCSRRFHSKPCVKTVKVNWTSSRCSLCTCFNKPDTLFEPLSTGNLDSMVLEKCRQEVALLPKSR